MASAALGSASLIASLNASNLLNGLQNAQNKVKQFGQQTKSVWDKIGGAFGGGGGGFLAKSLGAGFFGGLAGAIAIRSFDFIREGISDVITGKAKWTQELGRLSHAYQLLEKNIDRALKTRDEWRDASTPAERGRSLMDDILGTGPELVAAERKIKGIREKLETLNSFGLTNTFATLFGTRDRDKAFLEADLGRAESGALKLSDRLAELKEAKLRLDPLFDPAVRTSINAFMKDLDDKMATMGMTAEEAALKLLKLRIGDRKGIIGVGDLEEKLGAFKAAKLAEEKAADLKKFTEEADEFTRSLESMAHAIKHADVSAERMKANEFFGKGLIGPAADEMLRLVGVLEGGRKTKQLQDFNKALDEQRLSMGLSTVEAKLLDAAMDGLATNELWNSGAFQRAAKMNLASMDTVPKFAAAIEAGSQEAFSLDLKHRFKDEGVARGEDPVAVNKEANRILKRIEKLLEKNKAGVW